MAFCEIASAASSVEPHELLAVALRMKSKALWQRLGFLADLANWQWGADVREELRTAIPKSQRSVFGPKERRSGDIGYVSDWGLFVNLPARQLLADVQRAHHDQTS